jgi:hypothetical protein
MASFAPSLSYQTSEDTDATFKNKVNSKGFCVTHPDVRVRVKKVVGDDIITPCPKCDAVHALDLESRKKNEKTQRAIERARAKKECGEDIRLSEDDAPPIISTHNPMAPQQQQQQQQQQPQQQMQYVQQQQGQHQPVVYVMNGALPVVKEDLLKDTFSSSAMDCCDNPVLCCCVAMPCCLPFAVIGYASKVGISDTHGLCPLISAVVATAYYPCSLVLCHKKMTPCFLTSLLKRGMEKHKVKNAPDPCGDNGCCDCWLQMIFCVPCTVCMLWREAKKFPVKN